MFLIYFAFNKITYLRALSRAIATLYPLIGLVDSFKTRNALDYI
jgi:hypothetical protein